MVKYGVFLAAATVFALASAPAAGVQLVGTTFQGNDCIPLGSGGLFNVAGSDICNVTNGEIDPLTRTLRRFSPLVAQFDSSGLKVVNNTLYPSLNGGEFALTGVSPPSVAGTFTYTPGAGDPDIRYWATEDNNQFLLSWFVPDADLATCISDSKGTSCLAAALVIPTATALAWRTDDLNPLSHITFYDTGPAAVPIPPAILLFGSGLAGLGLLRRHLA